MDAGKAFRITRELFRIQTRSYSITKASNIRSSAIQTHARQCRTSGTNAVEAAPSFGPLSAWMSVIMNPRTMR